MFKVKKKKREKNGVGWEIKLKKSKELERQPKTKMATTAFLPHGPSTLRLPNFVTS
jgi:hypothetical protein